MYLNGYCASEIHDLIGEQFKVTYGTVRNDIVRIRKMWKSDVDHQDELEGKNRYLASLRQIRRKALTGWTEDQPTVGGVIKRVHGRSHELAHKVDKEIAQLSGVHLASNDRTIHLSVEEARKFMGQVMEIIMRRVTDSETQDLIIKDLEELSG
jgi:hypothetical protein